MNATDHAYAYIRDGILGNKFPSDTRLTELWVAQALGVSRTPVREALRRLSSEGFVEILPNIGARVTCWTTEELTEISMIRSQMEGYAASLSAKKATMHDVDRMKSIVYDMQINIESSDAITASRNNVKLHNIILQSAYNKHLERAATTLLYYPVIARKYTMFDKDRLYQSHYHHIEIVTAIERRDPEWAAAAMKNHILCARGADDVLGMRSAVTVNDVLRGDATSGAS